MLHCSPADEGAGAAAKRLTNTEEEGIIDMSQPQYICLSRREFSQQSNPFTESARPFIT